MTIDRKRNNKKTNRKTKENCKEESEKLIEEKQMKIKRQVVTKLSKKKQMIIHCKRREDKKQIEKQ